MRFKLIRIKTSAIIIAVFIAAVTFHFVSFAANDTPHNASNNMSCGSCHGEGLLQSFWGGSGIYSTYDELCLSCHTETSGGPYTDKSAPWVMTHSDAGGSALAECRDCHNPHYQRQKVYKNTDANNLYLATGKIQSCVYSGKDPDTNKDISTFTFSTITYKTGTGWNATRLSKKTGDYRGAILFPNVGKLGYNYPITAVVANTITVNGNLTTECSNDYFNSTTFAVMYGQYIKDAIDVGGVNKTVKVFDQTGANSFADGDTTYDGVCEVCHTQTKYHRNNGTDARHFATSRCTPCHKHMNGLRNSGAEGPSHSTHVDDDKGPHIECTDCHDNYDYPRFKDGKNLSETTVCDNCHSPGGSFDGVGYYDPNDPDFETNYPNSVAYGAKYNWKNGIYSGDSIKIGKEKWCAGCHDESPANSKADGSGINAPNVIGRETESTPYGTGYGFYKTGHGLPKYENYPASGVPGAGANCTDCHDVTKSHIDHEHRTYKASLDNYQEGYRLASVNGGPPMDIPRNPTGWDNCNWYFLEQWQDFALCYKCHDRKKVFGGPQYKDPTLKYYSRYAGNEYYQPEFTTNFRQCSTCEPWNEGTATSVTAHTLTDSNHTTDWNTGGLTILVPDVSHPELFYWIKSYDNTTHTITVADVYDMLADNPALAGGGTYYHTTKDLNSHNLHFSGRFAQCGPGEDWDSDWDSTGDSPISCPACHNVHGSPSARMLRHGELISTYGTQDKVPALEFFYQPYPPNNTTLKKSMGGRIRQLVGGPGTISVNHICSMCHPNYKTYNREPVVDIDPFMVMVEASDTSGGGCGIQNGDQVIITFNKETNGSGVITDVTQLSAILPVSGKNWGSGTTVAWSNAGGHTDDTLTVTLSADSTVDLGDIVVADELSIQDVSGNAVANQKKITGTFGCI
jgi:hypothetical protein